VHRRMRRRWGGCTCVGVCMLRRGTRSAGGAVRRLPMCWRVSSCPVMQSLTWSPRWGSHRTGGSIGLISVHMVSGGWRPTMREGERAGEGLLAVFRR